MSGPNEISVEKLHRLIGTPSCPQLIDVRTDDDFADDPRLVPTATKLAHNAVSPADIATNCVVICQRGAKLSHGVAAVLRNSGKPAVSLEGGFLAWREAQLPLVPMKIIPAHPNRWVTRHRPKIDRIACPWLIRRFIDPEAQFLFVPPDHVEGVAQYFNATPFDMPEGFWTHRGETCSFDTMLEEFCLKTGALQHMAKIIRAADTNTLEQAPEAAGLLAISLGLSRQYSDDLEQLQAGLTIYDALYRWCRDATEESHNWPVNAKTKA